MPIVTPALIPQAVSRALRRCGFEKSQFIASGQVRGWGRQTTGFRVRKASNKRDVIVEHLYENHRTMREGDRHNALEQYQKSLWTVGLVAVIEEDVLRVSAAGERPESATLVDGAGASPTKEAL